MPKLLSHRFSEGEVVSIRLTHDQNMDFGACQFLNSLIDQLHSVRVFTQMRTSVCEIQIPVFVLVCCMNSSNIVDLNS